MSEVLYTCVYGVKGVQNGSFLDPFLTPLIPHFPPDLLGEEGLKRGSKGVQNGSFLDMQNLPIFGVTNTPKKRFHFAYICFY